MADRTTTLHLRMTDGLSAAAQKAARSMHGVSQAADKLANKRLRVGGLDQVAAQARRVNLTMLSMERDLERAVQRRVTALQRAEKARQAEAAAAARAAEAERRHNSWRARAGRAVDGVVTAGVGAGVAVRTMAPKVERQLTFDHRLNLAATTAAGAGTHGEMKAAKAEISAAIAEATKQGGTRDEALDAIGILIASGKFGGPKGARAALPAIVKTAYATGSDPAEMAKAAATMVDNGVAIEQLGTAFDMLARATQEGNFEFRDLAKWLPKQLAAAASLGFRGLAGPRELGSLNQISMKTAGDPDAAGNNLLNLLLKLSSPEMGRALAKAVEPEKGDPTTPGKTTGKGKNRKTAPGEFDWETFRIRQQIAGVDPITAVAGLLNRELAKNKNYAEIQAQLANARDDGERTALLERAASIAEGGQVGKFLADQQALLALLAIMNGREEKARLDKEIANSKGAVDNVSGFMLSQAHAQWQGVQNRIDAAHEATFGSLSGPMARLLEGVNGLADAFPKATSAVVTAASAFSGVAAAFAGMAIWSKVFGGGTPAAARAGGGAAGTAGAAGRSFLRSGFKGGLLGGALYWGGTTAIDAGFGLLPGRYPAGYDPEKEKDLGVVDRLKRIWNGYPTARPPDPSVAADVDRIQRAWGVEDGRADHRLGPTAPLPPSRPGGASAPLPPVRPPDMPGTDAAGSDAAHRLGSAFKAALDREIEAATASATAKIRSWAANIQTDVTIRVTPRVDGAELRANHGGEWR